MTNRRAQRRRVEQTPEEAMAQIGVPEPRVKKRSRLVIEQMDSGYVVSTSNIVFMGSEQMVTDVVTSCHETSAGVREAVAAYLAAESDLNPAGGAIALAPISTE